MAPFPSIVFISYARDDVDFAILLSQHLRQSGVEIWIDVLNLPAGIPWDNQIEKALEECLAVLVILSPVSVKSETVKDEVAEVLERGKPVFPVLKAPCERPLRLRRLHYVDFTLDYATGLERLLLELRRVLPNFSKRADHPPPRARKRKATGDIDPKPVPSLFPAPPPEQSLDTLLRLLDERLHEQQVRILVPFERAAKGVEDGLISFLGDPDEQTRMLAAYCLGKIGSEELETAVKVAYRLTDKDHRVRQGAIVALANMGHWGAIYVRQIASLLHDTDPYVKTAARDALAKLRPENTTEAPK